MATTYSNLLFHIAFSTKYRRPIITDDIRDRLYEYIGGIIRDQHGSLLEIGGMPDHVHLLAKLSARVALSDVLRLTKANSSKSCNETFELPTPFAWQRGFGAFSVSASNVEQVRAYIENQEAHHQTTSFQDEFPALLQRHGIEFMEGHLFEKESVV